MNAEGAVNAKEFLDDFRKRRGLYYVPEDLAERDEELLAWLNSLCDKHQNMLGKFVSDAS